MSTCPPSLIGDWQHLDQRIHTVSLEIQLLAQQDPACERLMTVPGIGPIISSATVAAIGTGDAFSKGRDFGARLGLVPKQISTGDRTILGKISKRGNKYLRTLFVQAARVVLLRPVTWKRHGLQPWIAAAARRLHHNVLAMRLPTNSRTSPGACCTTGATSRKGRTQKQPPNPHEDGTDFVSMSSCSIPSRPSLTAAAKDGQP